MGCQKSTIRPSLIPLVFFGRSFTLLSVAGGSIGSLVPFGVKNVFKSLKIPGLLAFLKRSIVSAQLDKDVVQVLVEARKLLITEGKSSNETLRRLANQAGTRIFPDSNNTNGTISNQNRVHAQYSLPPHNALLPATMSKSWPT